MSKFILNITKEEFAEIMNSSNTVSEVLFKLYGDSSKKLYPRYLHFVRRHDLVQEREALMERSQKARGYLIENNHLLVKGSLKANHSTIRNRLIKYKLIPYKCICGNEGSWNGVALSLQLDHIDGDKSNNVLENLRFLCPNCHSQTSTYCSKNRKVVKRVYKCSVCGENEIKNRSATKCKDCTIKAQGSFGLRALTKEELQRLVDTYTFVDIIKMYKTCQEVLKEVLDLHKIQQKPKGYWQTKEGLLIRGII